MAEEVWQAIPGACLYEASSEGRVRSWSFPNNRQRKRRATPRLMVAHRRPDGYCQVKITTDEGVCLTRKVHGLVLRAFLGVPPGDWTASHMNGDRADNRIANLAWESLAQNIRRQVPDGTRNLNRPRGEDNHMTHLTTDDVLTIRREYDSGKVSQYQFAARFNVTRPCVGYIVRRMTWRHVIDEAT
jgi:hypothetical protein